MTLPALADVQALADRIPGGVANEDEPRAQAALEDASAAIRTHVGRSWVDDEGELDFGDLALWSIDEIQRITVAAAKRAFTNPDSVTQRTQTLGDASETVELADASSDVYLTAAEKASLNAMVAVAGQVPGLASVRVVAPAAASGSRLLSDPWAEDDEDLGS